MLDQLPPDTVLLILKWLDERSLCRIASVCKYLAKLSKENIVWKSHLQQQLITNCLLDLSLSNKRICEISTRWSKGKGKITTVAKFNKNYLPWLQFNQTDKINYKSVYLSVAGKLRQWHFNNNKSNHLKEVGKQNVIFDDVDVSSFRVQDGMLTAIGWKGKLAWCSLGAKEEMHIIKAHEVDGNAIDHNKDIITSGCQKGMFKIWRWGDEKLFITKQMQKSFADSILSLSINNGIVAVGTGSKNNCEPFYIMDLHSGALSSGFGLTQHVNGAGILDMTWMDPNLLLTSSYDTFTRLWDMRVASKQCVRAWEEPHDNAVYSISSDQGNAFVSGSCRHGVVRLWDVRMRRCLQSFYTSGRTSSPVYSIKMTSTRIFVALAKHLRTVEFC